MADSASTETKVVSVNFMNKLGFELPDEVYSFYLDGQEIVFNLQVFKEISDCNFEISSKQERFPLNEEQLSMLKEAGYTDPDGYLLDI